MKNNIKIFGLAIALTLAVVSAQADCGGCGDLQIAKQKVSKITNAEEPESRKIFDEAIKAVLAMASTMGPTKPLKMSTLQAREYVDLLKISIKIDRHMAIIEDTLNVIRANHKTIAEELKKLSQEDAREIAQRIDIIMMQSEFGNDSAQSFVDQVKPAATRAKQNGKAQRK